MLIQKFRFIGFYGGTTEKSRIISGVWENDCVLHSITGQIFRNKLKILNSKIKFKAILRYVRITTNICQH
jgi:hypothetical protein